MSRSSIDAVDRLKEVPAPVGAGGMDEGLFTPRLLVSWQNRFQIGIYLPPEHFRQLAM